MPHFPSLNIRTNGIEILINAYKECINSKKIFLTDGVKIIWKNLRLFIEYLSLNEVINLKDEYVVREKHKVYNNKFNNNKFNNKKPLTPEKELETKLINLPMTDRFAEQYINPSESGWETRYYRVLFDISSKEEERKKEICINYLEGLEWTYRYYKSNCVDWRWTYKYDYPPLLVDLIKYIPYFDSQYFLEKQTLPVTPIVQLSYVLPKQSLMLIPNKFGDFLLKENPDWYVDDCEFQWAFCKYFWESHVKLPDIDIAELENLITIEKHLSL